MLIHQLLQTANRYVMLKHNHHSAHAQDMKTGYLIKSPAKTHS